MIKFTHGNLLESHTEALVNTVNTVGVMGRGIALMFKEAFPDNYREYEYACKHERVQVGHMFVTQTSEFSGSRWIINFPTKKHWRHPAKLEWIVQGLADLKKVIQDKKIRSVALPPLGAGNGGLEWAKVRKEIVQALEDLKEVDILVYEPTDKYQNIAKSKGVEELTPARVLVAEMIRRYWVLGTECTYLEVQKLGWFLERTTRSMGMEKNLLNLKFKADKYGPYSISLRHLLNALDGTYLHCDKRLGDAYPTDAIWFDQDRRKYIDLFLQQDNAGALVSVLAATAKCIDGFESPFGMELLATVDWLIAREHREPNIASIKAGLREWPAGQPAAERKLRLFDERLIDLALSQLTASDLS